MPVTHKPLQTAAPDNYENESFLPNSKNPDTLTHEKETTFTTCKDDNEFDIFQIFLSPDHPDNSDLLRRKVIQSDIDKFLQDKPKLKTNAIKAI